MARTKAIPTTLDEYMKFVREEALKVQKDMDWPDEKMNETLVAIGLPPKVKHDVLVEITGRTFVSIPMDDALTLEDAQKKVLAEGADAAIKRVRDTGYSLNMVGTEITLRTEPLPIEVGAFDSTGSNSTFAPGRRRGRLCEQYGPSSHYCTRLRGHDGQHAYGDSIAIKEVWDQ